MKPFNGPCLKATINNGSIAKEIDPPFGTILNLKTDKSNATAKATSMALSTMSLVEKRFSSKIKPFAKSVKTKLIIDKIIAPALSATSLASKSKEYAMKELANANRNPLNMNNIVATADNPLLSRLKATNKVPNKNKINGRKLKIEIQAKVPLNKDSIAFFGSSEIETYGTNSKPINTIKLAKVKTKLLTLIFIKKSSIPKRRK